MRGLTICQPFASLIAVGQKRVENRKWETPYRGPLAIHAGKSRSWLKFWKDEIPAGMLFGHVIATAKIIDCVPIEKIDEASLQPWLEWLKSHVHATGPFCWVLADVKPLKRPFEWAGGLGLITIPDRLIEEASK
jgi:activating signal cointegrator 1